MFAHQKKTNTRVAHVGIDTIFWNKSWIIEYVILYTNSNMNWINCVCIYCCIYNNSNYYNNMFFVFAVQFCWLGLPLEIFNA